MRPFKLTHFFLMLAVLALAVLACDGGGIVPSEPGPVSPTSPSDMPATDGETRTRLELISATVQIYGLFNQQGELVPGYVGSGTIINRNGLILTNAHVASPASQGEADLEPDALAVGLVEAEDRPPVFSYLAEVLAVDGTLDLAVIQITSSMDGDSVDPQSLDLPYVPFGDSDEVHLGDHVNIFGFPAIGGETITYTAGNVSGFTAEDQVGDRAWIKTDAAISGGNSGGLAANDSGQIIGVPTIASSGAAGDITDCRVVQDTNGDGQLTNQDTCIPIGGFINGLRPVNLALPLIKAAQSGQQYSSPFGSLEVTSSGSGKESFTNLTWYAVSGGSDCVLGETVNSYPSNSEAVAAVFNFSDMTDGQEWAEAWTVDGTELYSGKYAWNQGDSGESYTCIYSSEGALPDGNYHLQLFAGPDLPLLAESNVVVGDGTGGTTKPSTARGVTLSGKITDADTGKPIPDALVFVLKPGVLYDQWSQANYPEKDVYTYTSSDARGDYVMPIRVERNVSYTVVAGAKGYYDAAGDGLMWTDTDPANYQLDITLSK
jgi:serine protease Do